MDPYYFLKTLKLVKTPATNKDLELSDFYYCQPDGSWVISIDYLPQSFTDKNSYKILYENICYTRIEYDNDIKTLLFFQKDILTKQLILELVEI